MRSPFHAFVVVGLLAVFPVCALAETIQQAAASFVAHPTYCNHLLGQAGHEDGLTTDYGQATATVLNRILDAEPKFSISDSVESIRKQCSGKLASATDASGLKVSRAAKK